MRAPATPDDPSVTFLPPRRFLLLSLFWNPVIPGSPASPVLACWGGPSLRGTRTQMLTRVPGRRRTWLQARQCTPVDARERARASGPLLFEPHFPLGV